MLNRLERKFGHLAIPHLTIYIVVAQAVFFLGLVSRPQMLGDMVLVPQQVLGGEVWRLVTFLAIPPCPPGTRSIAFDTFCSFFGLYLLWIMGGALEQQWGAFRYNIYLLIGYIATIASVWLVPWGVATNVYLMSSVFLAFAFLYPDFQLYILLLIPVRIKWLALITWVFYGIALLSGEWITRVVILAAVLNFLLFFWRDLIDMVRRGGRKVRHQSQAVAARRAESEPFHRCIICGRTEESDPELEFRYCPNCTNTPCYCMEHIFEHEHA